MITESIKPAQTPYVLFLAYKIPQQLLTQVRSNELAKPTVSLMYETMPPMCKEAPSGDDRNVENHTIWGHSVHLTLVGSYIQERALEIGKDTEEVAWPEFHPTAMADEGTSDFDFPAIAWDDSDTETEETRDLLVACRVNARKRSNREQHSRPHRRAGLVRSISLLSAIMNDEQQTLVQDKHINTTAVALKTTGRSITINATGTSSSSTLRNRCYPNKMRRVSNEAGSGWNNETHNFTISSSEPLSSVHLIAS